MIPEQKIALIKQKANIVDVISSYINLSKKGANYMGKCPFHSDNEPSLVVSPNKGIFKCFVCGSGGDVISFVKDYENLTYPQALKKLADRYGIKLDEYVDKSKLNKDPKKERIYSLNKEALNFFKYNLAQSKVAKNYLVSRKINKNIVNKFSIGYADKNFEGLTKFLLNKGYTKEELVDNSLSNIKNGELIDFFVNRIIIPIFDINGNTIAFSGRSLERDNNVKYLNSKETIVFIKSKTIYNLSEALKYSKRDKKIYLVEGFFDVISLSKKNINNAIALMGTNINTNFTSLINNAIKVPLSIVPDNDIPGLEAAIKIGNLFKSQNIDFSYSLIPEKFKDIDEWIKSLKEDENLDISSSLQVEVLYRKLKKEYNLNNLSELSKFINLIKNEMSKMDQSVANQFAKKIAKENNLEYNDLKINTYDIDENTMFSFIDEREYVENIEKESNKRLSKDDEEKLNNYFQSVKIIIISLFNNFNKTKDLLDEYNLELNYLNKYFHNLLSVKKNNMDLENDELLEKLDEELKDKLIIWLKQDINYNNDNLREAIMKLDNQTKLQYCNNIKYQMDNLLSKIVSDRIEDESKLKELHILSKQYNLSNCKLITSKKNLTK